MAELHCQRAAEAGHDRAADSAERRPIRQLQQQLHRPRAVGYQWQRVHVERRRTAHQPAAQPHSGQRGGAHQQHAGQSVLSDAHRPLEYQSHHPAGQAGTVRRGQVCAVQRHQRARLRLLRLPLLLQQRVHQRHRLHTRGRQLHRIQHLAVHQGASWLHGRHQQGGHDSERAAGDAAVLSQPDVVSDGRLHAAERSVHYVLPVVCGGLHDYSGCRPARQHCLRSGLAAARAVRSECTHRLGGDGTAGHHRRQLAHSAGSDAHWADVHVRAGLRHASAHSAPGSDHRRSRQLQRDVLQLHLRHLPVAARTRQADSFHDGVCGTARCGLAVPSATLAERCVLLRLWPHQRVLYRHVHALGPRRSHLERQLLLH